MSRVVIDIFDVNDVCELTPHLVRHKYEDKPLFIPGVLQNASSMRTH
ncbi:hypothetical protein KAX97_12790 [candidate division WOR-3 bacterium]|nr:hypothetical protein [candidate division WOR-3 bacterium]